MPTVAGPAVFFAGRPPAERAADKRARGVQGFLLVGLVINNNNGLVVREGAHAPNIMT
jgi:hypothetical protein